jgi:transketolase
MQRLSSNDLVKLKKQAIRIRIKTLEIIGNLGFGHIGGSMSITELLTALYFGEILKLNPKNPRWGGRDWLILSKGHAGPSLYTALAMKGYFPMSDLGTLNQPGTSLPSHCDRNLTHGVDMTTGSLGLGLSMATGVALGHRLDNRDNRVYLILGDGECQEGQIWEAALYAAHKHLDNLIAFIDYNHQQLDGYTEDINDLGDLRNKFEAFGWDAQEINGHEFEEIYSAIGHAWETKGKPSMIVMNTIKGQGCSFAEGNLLNHLMYVTKEEIEEAITILNKKLNKIKTS